jgi:transcriptional regulator with XRE-family HTH domain
VRVPGIPIGLQWKLRRVAADLRKQDIAGSMGISTSRYSALERGEQEPTDLERAVVDRLLPELPLLGRQM